MRIAQVAPLAESVPPKLYGGTERVVSWLTEELVSHGHDVTLFASGDSKTKARLIPGRETALRLEGINNHVASHLNMLNEVYRRADDFDVIHCHLDLLQLAMFPEMPSKLVTTLHGRLDVPDLAPFYRTVPRMPLISISDQQRKPMPPGLNWLATVYHGLPAEVCPFRADGGTYLAFLGRISRDKRPDRAIEIAIRCGLPLKIAAKVDEEDKAYFETAIVPLLDHPLIDFIGEIDEGQKGGFLGGALALLFPIDWPEPFGLVMIEAMSCGTPVIAWDEGSVQEIMEDGTSGTIVRTIDEAVIAVGRIRSIDRRGVRRYFESRFTTRRMAKDYVAAYEGMIGTGRSISPPRTLETPIQLAAE